MNRYAVGVLCVAFAAHGSALLLQNRRTEGKTRVKVGASEVRLTTAERRSLNTFFSNFSEVFVEPFERGKIANNRLIEFGIRHNLTNNDRLWTQKGLAAHYVEESVMKYFGRRITRHQAPSDIYPYKNGFYGYPRAEGEGPVFSQVTALRALGNREYQADVRDYAAGQDWEGDPQASPSLWRRTTPPDVDVPRLFRQMKATIRKETSGNGTRYVLLDYREVKR